ncbi:bromodomain-containing protein DDB_G0280777-like [Lolium rigidum]|uniref:bromodomain-containing protein DDB_G0280777-like n=1 Tax=Lolium rigidum TaxID=89674 RepID=UPI001F5C6495|nr:bromodomain-containing protein DDB_G0280777-like [Lolium rigidum]
MASPARPAAASVSGAFGLPPDARCAFDQTRRRAEDLQDKRLVRTFVNVYGQPQPQEQEPCYPREAVMAAVEECMRKQADGLLHSLEGIGGRLSQLELYCYKLERSIGELRSDVMDYHSDATVNFRCIDKNIRQVQKAVQVLQDRHEPAAADMAQQQLAKLQIAHEFPARANEAAPPLSMLAAARETASDHHSAQFANPEVSFLPMHQVNATQSPAMPMTQGGSGYILQQLVPVSLHDQQHPGQAAVYYMQSQSHVKSAENKSSESFVQVMQPHLQNPEPRAAAELPQQSSQTTEMCPPLQQHHMLQMPAQHHESQAWRSVSQQQQQYSVQQVPQQIVQQKASSPHAQSAPQVTLMYPPYCSQKLANATAEALPRSLVMQSPYSSPQQKHHEVVPSFYGQGNTILLPTAERSIQHQQAQQVQPHRQAAEHNVQHQQPQQLQPHSQGSYPPQPSKPSHCSVASYAVQGGGRAYSAAYENPSECPATVVAVLPQHPATAPMAFHHLGSQVMHKNPYGSMFETATVVGYPQDAVGNLTLPAVTAALQPVDSNATMVNKLNAGSNVTSPRDWSA